MVHPARCFARLTSALLFAPLELPSGPEPRRGSPSTLTSDHTAQQPDVDVAPSPRSYLRLTCSPNARQTSTPRPCPRPSPLAGVAPPQAQLGFPLPSFRSPPPTSTMAPHFPPRHSAFLVLVSIACLAYFSLWLTPIGQAPVVQLEGEHRDATMAAEGGETVHPIVGLMAEGERRSVQLVFI